MKKFLVLAGTIFAVIGAAGDSVAQRLVTPLDSDLQPLVSDFDARSASPRLVVILSPT